MPKGISRRIFSHLSSSPWSNRPQAVAPQCLSPPSVNLHPSHPLGVPIHPSDVGTLRVSGGASQPSIILKEVWRNTLPPSTTHWSTFNTAPISECNSPNGRVGFRVSTISKHDISRWFNDCRESPPATAQQSIHVPSDGDVVVVPVRCPVPPTCAKMFTPCRRGMKNCSTRTPKWAIPVNN